MTPDQITAVDLADTFMIGIYVFSALVSVIKLGAIKLDASHVTAKDLFAVLLVALVPVVNTVIAALVLANFLLNLPDFYPFQNKQTSGK